jgi:2-dehydropantoate 2-reductase
MMTMATSKRIAILGSGANGSAVGADLIAAGFDVTLIEQWPAHVRAIRSGGLTIAMPEGELEVEADPVDLCDVARLRGRFDIVLILMKAYDTRWACQMIEPYVKDDGVVVAVQNGLTTREVLDVMGPDRTLGSVIEISSMMVDPGRVERHSGPARSYFAVGHPTGAESRSAEVAEILSHSGQVEVVDNIEAAKWMKLVSNCTTLAASAILDSPIIAAPDDPEMRALMLRAGQEALDLGGDLGFPPLPIFGLDQAGLGSPERIVETLLETLLGGFVLPTTTSTILHDWRKGRRSETDDINGVVVARRTAEGIHAPANSAIVDVAHRIERGELEPGPGNLPLLLEQEQRDEPPHPRLR